MRRRLLSGAVPVLIVYLLMSVTMVFGGGTREAVEVERVLRVGQVGSLASLEPYRNAAPNYLFIENVFDQLLFHERAEGVYKPEAAVEWELADDSMSARVILRDGMVTHAGTPVDAEMLKWNFEERVLQPDKGAAAYGQYSPFIQSIEVVDNLTLDFAFRQPTPHWADLMALMIVADPDMFVTDDGEIALSNEQDKQIGSGAFEYVEYVPGSHYYMRRFEDYWEEEVPRLDRIEVEFFGDASSMVAALEAGEIDYAFNPPFEAARRFMDRDGFTVWVPETQGIASIMMINPQREQLRDPRVRQAINYAIDRQAINEVAYAGMGSPTSVFTLPGTLGYTRELEIPLSGDPERARQLLEDAGSPNISVRLTYGGGNEIYRLICEVVAENLQGIGIDATLDPVDHGVYIQRRTSQNFDLLPSLIAGINKHPAGLQDSFVFQVNEDGSNPFFADIEVQQEFIDYRDAFARGLSATSNAEADAAFQEALLAAKQGSWVTPIVGQPFNLAITPSNLKGVTWTEADKPVFKYTYWE